METRELRAAFVGAWLIVSALLLGVLVAPFALSDAELDRLVPVCEWKARYNRECPACGLTTAFLLISHGEIVQAQLQNRASLPLYLGFVLNSILFVAVLLFRRRSIRALLLPTRETIHVS